MKNKIKIIIKIITKLMPDILALTGAISVSYGAYLFIEPLGYIVMGIMLIASAVILSKS